MLFRSAWSYAFAAAVFISIYIVLFMKMARITFRQKIMNAITSSLFFLLLHFNLLKICESDNVYLFWAQDVTCFFYYTIGSVINASLVLLCLQKDISLMLISKGSMLKKGIIILISYIAVFSNLFTSIILLSYCSANGLYKIIRYTKTKEKKLSWLEHIIYETFVIVMWLVSAFFEANGGRAHSFSRDTESIIKTIITILKWSKRFNPLCIIILSLIFLCAIVISIRRGNKLIIRMLFTSISCLFFSMLYLSALATRTGIHYLERADVIYSLLFFLILTGSISLCHLVGENGKILIVIPLVLYIMMCNTMNGDHVFKENISRNIPPNKAKAVDKYIIEQINDGMKMNLPEIIIKVPENLERDDNWPHPDWMGSRISTTLIRHGITDKDIKIIVEPDHEVNRQFQLPY